jgi:putative FmdB family regulatory protein
VPTYEYRCRECDAVFELERPMRESSAPATCPDGHRDALRVLSLFAAVTAGPAAGATAAPAAPAAPCGPACACHPH